MARDIGIDLGTANVLIHLKGRGIVLNEPSLVAVDKRTQEVIAFGNEAYDMIGRTPESIEVIQPLKSGVIDDFDLAEALLVLFFEKINSRTWFSRPNVLICAPSNVTEIEKLALIEAVEKAGGGQIFIEEEPKVAGVGAGIDLLSPKGSMVIDIGGGTCDIAIIAASEIVHSESLKLAGDDFDEAIIHYIKKKYNLLIGNRTAEQAKIKLATAVELSESKMNYLDIKGRDMITGLPKSININSNDIYHALYEQLQIIARTAKTVIEEAAPEMASDIMDKGIMMTGGGAMIYGVDNFLTQYLGVSVITAEQPMNCVAMGTGLMLEMIQNGQLQRINLTWKQKWERFVKRFKRRWLR